MKGMAEVGRLFNDNQLIVAEVLQSTTRFVANRDAYADPWKKAKLDNIGMTDWPDSPTERIARSMR